MFEASINKKSLFKIIIFSGLIIFFVFSSYFFNQKNFVVFCDVGQGDAAYIRTKEKIDILVDAGPNKAVLSCLGKYMPFYDRKIELVILSHPQNDHFNGFLGIIDRYQIETFVIIPLHTPSKNFNQLIKKLKEKKITIKNFYAGEKINILNHSSITFLWPTRKFFKQNIIEKKTDLEKEILGVYSAKSDLNDFSHVFLFSRGDFDILFTGDASPLVLNLVARINKEIFNKKIEVLKVPHHGSKNGLNIKFLRLAEPDLSVISVGKKNAYGHPSKEILEMFQALRKKYLRTDEFGDIKIDFDSQGWSVIEKYKEQIKLPIR